ncbi:MAG: hypothetical protein RMY28_010125 [Nostoc sp. ChiSLP01]|nr:hypothetical protein [Nostoc sp. CmiSLP01]MDZ8285089.1 hypothetical protein [Nostoc sp. ChiSLP01]
MTCNFNPIWRIVSKTVVSWVCHVVDRTHTASIHSRNKLAIAVGGYSVPSHKFFGQPTLPNQ